MFNALNKVLVLITVGAIVALIGMGWWLNLTISQKAVLEQAIGIQEQTISILQKDAVDREYTILSNQMAKDNIATELDKTITELTRLKNESTNSCIDEPLPDSILEFLHKNSNEGGVRLPTPKLVDPN